MVSTMNTLMEELGLSDRKTIMEESKEEQQLISPDNMLSTKIPALDELLEELAVTNLMNNNNNTTTEDKEVTWLLPLFAHLILISVRIIEFTRGK
jgi:antitoxin component of MazEF toxin-antitoxin module